MTCPSLLVFVVTLAVLAGGCGQTGGSSAVPARAGAPARVEPGAASAAGTPQMTAIRETEPVPHGDDAADDAAIWIDPDDPAQSTIIGTDKRGGLAVYDLHGRQLQYVAGGRPNNVDLRDGLHVGERRVTVVAAEERDHNQIVLYRVDPVTRRLHPLAARRIAAGSGVYGSCMYRSAVSGRFYVFVSSYRGTIRQYRLLPRADGLVDAALVRKFDVGGLTEGCVADDATGALYVSEENRGIWRYRAEPGASRRRSSVDRTGRRGNLTADVEGLALVKLNTGARYLLASNQGQDSYTVYRRGDDDEYITTFRIDPGATADGVQNTDGIEATTTPLGPDFPAGMFVAQDGDNGNHNQNFKLVAWDLAALVSSSRR
jgi:3-phytase